MPLVMLKSDARARLKPCLGCGYSLRSNVDARNCPECGLAVRISLRGDDALEWSNPAWLRRMTLATAIIGAAHVGFLATVILIQVVVISTSRYGGAPLTRAWFVGVGTVLPATSALLLGVGALLLASFEGRYPDRVPFPRFLLRMGGVALVLLMGWELVQSIGGPVAPVTPPAWGEMMAAFVTELAVWAELQELARRLQLRRCRRFIWTASIGLLSTLTLWPSSFSPQLLLLFMRLLPWNAPVWRWTVASFAYTPFSTALLAYCCWRLHAAAGEAERNWVTDP